MAFPKGESGNPAGRTPGSKSWHSILRDQLRDDAPALVAKLKAMALDGDADALKFLVQAILPRERPTAAPVVIEGLGAARTLTQKAQAILDAVGAGELPPDVAASLINAVGQTARVVEIDELAKRIANLEEAMKNDR